MKKKLFLHESLNGVVNQAFILTLNEVMGEDIIATTNMQEADFVLLIGEDLLETLYTADRIYILVALDEEGMPVPLQQNVRTVKHSQPRLDLAIAFMP